jgi:hypothetical protein
MHLLVRMVVIAGGVLWAGFLGVILFNIANGKISLAGLLDTKGPAGPPTFSPARLQMLIATIVVAGQYLHAIVVNPLQNSLPTLPPAAVAVLGGSHAVYLGGKAIDAFIQPLLKNVKR